MNKREDFLHLEGHKVRSYDYDDQNDCFVEGTLAVVHDEYLIIFLDRWVVNGKDVKNFTPAVHPRIATARIVALDQARNMADAASTAAMFLDEETY